MKKKIHSPFHPSFFSGGYILRVGNPVGQIHHTSCQRVSLRITHPVQYNVQLVENRKQLAESQKEAALALQAKDNLRQSVCKTEKDISLLMEKQTALQTWFERYTAYSQLIPAVELITSLLTNLEMARAQSVSNRQLLDKVKKASEAEEQRLKSVQQEAERLNRLLPAAPTKTTIC